MRQKINYQTTIFEYYHGHPFAQQLKTISSWLDQHPRIREFATQDLIQPQIRDAGRKGLTVVSIIRAALLKQITSSTYEELAFQICDSTASQAFTRIEAPFSKATTLRANISRITASTWETMIRIFVRMAALDGLENGRITRTDSTVMDTHIHEPSDNSLLWDSVQIMNRHPNRG